MLAASLANIAFGITALSAQSGVSLWALRPDLRITSDGNAKSDIEPIIAAFVSDRGILSVVQPKSNVIKQFDHNGKLIRTIGGAGDGPGEFRAISAIGMIGDTLWVADRKHFRISLFRPDGKFLRSERDNVSVGRTSVVALLAGYKVLSAALEVETGSDRLLGVIRVHDLDGKVSQQLHREFTAPSVAKVGRQNVRLPFSDRALVHASPNGRFVAVVEVPTPTSSLASFVVHRLNLDGPTTSRDQGVIVAHKARKSLIDSLVAENLTMRGPENSNPTFRNDLLKAFSGYSWIPPFGRAMLDDAGAIWLQRSDDVSWIAIDSHAKPVGEIKLPPRNVAIAVRGDEFWTMEFDEFDVPSIVRYHIARK